MDVPSDVHSDGVIYGDLFTDQILPNELFDADFNFPLDIFADLPLASLTIDEDHLRQSRANFNVPETRSPDPTPDPIDLDRFSYR